MVAVDCEISDIWTPSPPLSDTLVGREETELDVLTLARKRENCHQHDGDTEVLRQQDGLHHRWDGLHREDHDREAAQVDH